jgi:hypothetical protein
MPRPKNQGLVYLRRSSDKQEISLPQQLEWAIAAAARDNVPLDATPADLAYMQERRLSSHKGIRLDDGISGSDLNRPGFLAVNRDALADARISHVFIYQRDRFARPEDALEMVQVEKKLLEAGITVVFSNAVSLPYQKGQQDIARDIGIMFGYYESGEFLRKHAERVLEFQRRLAREGYRTGGNPPYGFARWLVDGTGNRLEKLPRGKLVQQSGCHVRVFPDDFEKIAVWLQILELKAKGWGVKRIAQYLNDRGIPSPDAGRTRTDHGVKHLVSGKWNHNSVGELCRNPVILGIQQYGMRSEGKIRRLGNAGPRLLEEKDRTPEGTLRVIFNEPELRITKQVADPEFDEAAWKSIQQQMDSRGKVQRGIRRAKDPAKYPLACRIVDLTGRCGSVLYGRICQGRAIYTCGRYMRTDGAECASNSVDAEAMLRFTLKTLKQLVDRHGNREKLRALLLERARRAEEKPEVSPAQQELAGLVAKQRELCNQLAIVQRRMASEPDDARYEAIGAEFDRLRLEQRQTEEAITARQAATEATSVQTPEQQVESALGLLDDVTRIAGEPTARAEVNPLLERLGVWIGLTFAGVVKGKKRIVQRLQSGMITFGDRQLPVPLFGRDNVDSGPHEGEGGAGTASGCLTHGEMPSDHAGSSGGKPAKKATRNVIGGKGRDRNSQAGGRDVPLPPARLSERNHPDRLFESQPEGISITKVSRGDWIRTSDLLNPIQESASRSMRRVLHFQLICHSTLSTVYTISPPAHSFLCKLCKPFDMAALLTVHLRPAVRKGAPNTSASKSEASCRAGHGAAIRPPGDPPGRPGQPAPGNESLGKVSEDVTVVGVLQGFHVAEDLQDAQPEADVVQLILRKLNLLSS